MQQCSILDEGVSRKTPSHSNDRPVVSIGPCVFKTSAHGFTAKPIERSTAVLVSLKDLEQFPISQLLKVLCLPWVRHQPATLRVLDQVLLEQVLQVRHLIPADDTLL